MQLYQLHLTKEQLAAMPDIERQTLLLFGHIANELNMLRKAALFSGNAISDNVVMRYAEVAQAYFFIKLLGAKTFEAWEAFRRHFQEGLLGAKYSKQLADSEYGPTWEELKRRFGAGGLIITRLRNEHVFHFPDREAIERSFQSLSPDEDWSWYLSDLKANSFYAASDMIANNAIFQDINANEVQQATVQLMDEVLELSTDVDDVIGAVALILIDAHYPNARTQEPIVQTDDLRAVDDIKLPFFCDD